jgi:hydrogenase nickel incorporation protein HypB
VLVSTPEGDDKPLKYPGAVHTSDLMLLTKTDLAPYVNFSLDKAAENARRVNASIEVIPVSCTSGEGIDNWFEWFATNAGAPATERG